MPGEPEKGSRTGGVQKTWDEFRFGLHCREVSGILTPPSVAFVDWCFCTSESACPIRSFKTHSHGIIDAMDNGNLFDEFHAQRRQAAWMRCDLLIAVFQLTPP